MSNQDEIIFGIDLGTTHSSIAYVNEDGDVIVNPSKENNQPTPSAVLFEDGNWIVGDEAKKLAMLSPGSVVEMVKRHMGETDWRYNYHGIAFTAEEISSYIFRKLAADTEEILNIPVKEVVIAYPAYFGIPQREATALAGEIAGFNVREVINEPTAAAITYGLQKEQDQVVLVFDLGGGTFDVTVIEIKGGSITVIATGGDDNLGGRNWDEAVIGYLAEQWRLQTGSFEEPTDSLETIQDLWERSEQTKFSLTQRMETNVVVSHAGKVAKVTLTRDKFNELTASLLYRAIMFTRFTMDDAKARGFNHIDQILLVGGSTKMPQVKEGLYREFDIPIRMLESSFAIVKGAAIYGKKLITDKQYQDKAISEKPVVRSTDISTRPNFFVLLGLNPNIAWDPITFENILKVKRNEWSHQGNWVGDKALNAKKNLAFIPVINRVMTDEGLRALEAEAARAIIASERQLRFDAFEKRLGFINAVKSLEEADLNKLIDDFQDIFSPSEVRARITVPIISPIAVKKMVKQLDPTIAKRIFDLLQVINMKTLYEALQLPSVTATPELYRVAVELYKAVVRRMSKTADVTALTELAGLAMEVFKTEDTRRRYDESLRQGTIDSLLKKYDVLVSNTVKRKMGPEQVTLFLESAQQAGWEPEEALTKLEELSLQHKWILQAPGTVKPKVKCGYCEQLNDKDGKKCTNCGKDLYIACPNCGEIVASDQRACGYCGFMVGNRYMVDTQLEELQTQIDQRQRMIKVEDLKEFNAALDEVEKSWQPKKPDERSLKMQTLKDEVNSIKQAQRSLRVEPQEPQKTEINGTVQGAVIGNYNTITLNYYNNQQRTIPFLAPPQPGHAIVGRADLLRELSLNLFAGGNVALSALNGLPGVGKTALALALAHDYEVLGHFRDGVLWAGLGRESNVFSHLGAWGMALGISQHEMGKITDIRQRMQIIHRTIGTRRMLLVIDDAWSVEAAQAFKLGGPHCAHIVTTRLPEVAERFAGGSTITVRELNEGDSLMLIEQQAPGVSAEAPYEIREISRAVDGLPLPLILMGNYLRIQMKKGQPRRFRAALDRLLEVKERLQLAQPQGGLEYHPSLPEGIPLTQLAVIEISDEALDEEAQQVLRALSIFPSKPNSISEEAALAVAATSTGAIDTLFDFGLLESSGPTRYTLHQTINDYAQSKLTDAAVYERMVAFFGEYVATHKTNRLLLESETSNILAAVAIMLERGLTPPDAKFFAHFIRIVLRTRAM